MEEKRKNKQAIIFQNGNVNCPIEILVEEEKEAREIFLKKENFLNQSEHKLYFALKKLSNKFKNIEISTQVAINQIIEINENRKEINKIFNNAINKKSIDFVLWDINTTKIICCIELNGESHKLLERKARDEYLKIIFEKLNIPLIFLETKNYYDYEKIEEILLNIKKKK